MTLPLAIALTALIVAALAYVVAAFVYLRVAEEPEWFKNLIVGVWIGSGIAATVTSLVHIWSMVE